MVFYIIHFFSWFLAILSFDIFRIRRRIVLKNLDIVFTDTKSRKEKIKIGRFSYVSFFSTTLEFLFSPYLYKKAKVTFHGKENLAAIREQNKGLYGLCIHSSNWEYFCYLAASTISPIHVVVKKIGTGILARFIEKFRTNAGFSLIDRSTGKATTKIFEAIEKKEIVGFIADQKRPKGEHLPFFGRPASTNNSLIKLFLRKKAPIMPAIIKRKKPGVYEVTYWPEFRVEQEKGMSFKETVTHNTARMNLLVEKMILENPQEYFWMHNRWDI